MNIKHVQQDDSRSCAYACISMLSGEDLLAVKKTATYLNIYSEPTTKEIFKLLVFYNILPIPTVPVEAKYFEGDTYLLMLPSKNSIYGIYHCVLLQVTNKNSQILYDPKYKESQIISPIEIPPAFSIVKVEKIIDF